MAISRFFRTPAYPPGSGPDFVNAAALLDSPWSPADLLEKLQSVENSLGRVRESRWGARTIDLDLLFSGDAVLPDIDTQKKWTTLDPDSQRVVAPEQLILPHPRLQDRAFVLIPLADISPLWRHPILGQTVTEMADALPEGVKGAIRPL